MRVRLISKFVCVLRRQDTVSTAAVTGGGYDDEFGEVLPDPANGTSRREHAADKIPCQVDRREWGDQEMTGGGLEDRDVIYFVFHFRDLERLGLVNADGSPKIAADDRVESYKTRKGVLVEEFADPPGLWVTGVERGGFGPSAFGVPKRNLLIATCKPDRQGGLP